MTRVMRLLPHGWIGHFALWVSDGHSLRSWGSAGNRLGCSRRTPVMKFDSVSRTIAATVVGAASLGLVACSATEPADDRDPNAVRVAFYGDSYTRGTGAS